MLNVAVLQFVFVLGLIYGLITLVLEIKQKQEREKYQVGLSVLIIVISGIALFTLK
ncbi:MAG TPA: hypothetical protein VK067_05700 [Pseudogracilibacillus sp.]|nr:hypothetical protein [Pseudogracilibacillus sp.]